MKVKIKFLFCISISLTLLVRSSYAVNERLHCEYTTRSGLVESVNDIEKVPRIYRSNAKCVKIRDGEFLALPSEIKLNSREGSDVVSSSLGDVRIKWSKEVKGLLGKNPQRVISNSMNILSKIINSTSFSQKLSGVNWDWNIIFFGKDIPNSQVPEYLITNCHPGWMLPPSNIYIAVDRVYNGCNGQHSQGIADSELEHVLLHELGHAVEYKLLGGNAIKDLKRSEGFATWFSIYAANFSHVLDRGTLFAYYNELASAAIKKSPKIFNFSGSAEDYARAAMYFNIVEQKQGVTGILLLYDKLSKGGDFLSSVANMLNTSVEHIEDRF